jgi:hypothetical protein
MEWEIQRPTISAAWNKFEDKKGTSPQLAPSFRSSKRIEFTLDYFL